MDGVICHIKALSVKTRTVLENYQSVKKKQFDCNFF